MTEQNVLTPGEVAHLLGISPSTLRRWSTRFAEFLSFGAGHTSAGTASHTHRRYTQEDVAVLRTVRDMLSQGFTYEHVLNSLSLRAGVKEPREGELAAVQQEAAAP
ncbi:MAG: MerR family transcriptional regulator, partial [Anaerolineae bacterium]|nr:MerR family transcriptional regulator [Anaerolineae bacterium]